MELISRAVIGLVMACAVLGAIAAIRDEERGLGREFLEGLRSIGPIFIPVAGVMASIPYLSALIETAFGPAFASVGADPSIAATSVIAVDMGGYQLAGQLASSVETWTMAVVVGYMAGATIVFSIPVGLAMLDKRDHRYLALGVMAGILSVPIGVLATCALLVWTDPTVLGDTGKFTEESYTLDLSGSVIATNLLPLVRVVLTIALGLRFLPELMIKLFLMFGRAMDAAIKLVLVLAIVEMSTTGWFSNTGACSTLAGALGMSWEFDPIFADGDDQMRALEVAGYIGAMLCGAFPMVYLIRKWLARPVELGGRRLGLEPAGAAGLLAAIANILAMLRLVRDMRAEDKVVVIAFSVCAAFLFGDHLAFTANFQPGLIVPVLVGKLVGGIAAMGIARMLAVGKARELARATSSE